MRHVDEVVVCGDGFVDLTGARAVGLGAVVVRHERNMGYVYIWCYSICLVWGGETENG